MTIIDGLLIFFSIILAYYILVKILNKKGVFEKYNITLWGPALLVRTKKGRGFLKKIASKKRFWKAYGSFGIAFSLIAMIFLVSVFVLQFGLLFGLSPEQKAGLPGPEAALILPGINPILPLEYVGYVILALAIAIIVHEFSHGILTFAGNLKVKSLGILYLIIPVGAFCEPDEEELKKTETGKRMRVFAAGPLANFTTAFIVLLLFSFVFMSAVQPIDGAEVLYSYEDTPAEEIGLSSGMLIISFNDTIITNATDFSYAIDDTLPDQTVNFTYLFKGKTYNKQVNLTSIYMFTNNESHKNLSFLGVRFNNIRGDYLSSLKNPFTHEFPSGFLNLYAMPIMGYIIGYNPIASPFIENYEITGPLGALPTGLFWAIVTALYWIFWLNLAVGLFNVLPMVPLDGGYIFNDALGSFIKKIFKDISDQKREKIVKNISLVLSLIVLFLVLFPFFFKYI